MSLAARAEACPHSVSPGRGLGGRLEVHAKLYVLAVHNPKWSKTCKQTGATCTAQTGAHSACGVLRSGNKQSSCSTVQLQGEPDIHPVPTKEEPQWSRAILHNVQGATNHGGDLIELLGFNLVPPLAPCNLGEQNRPVQNTLQLGGDRQSAKPARHSPQSRHPFRGSNGLAMLKVAPNTTASLSSCSPNLCNAPRCRSVQ